MQDTQTSMKKRYSSMSFVAIDPKFFFRGLITMLARVNKLFEAKYATHETGKLRKSEFSLLSFLPPSVVGFVLIYR